MFYKIVTHGPYRIRQTASIAPATPVVLKASPVGEKMGQAGQEEGRRAQDKLERVVHTPDGKSLPRATQRLRPGENIIKDIVVFCQLKSQ